MNIFKNKFFILGNLTFLLLIIPVVIYFVKNQTTTRGSAEATTNLTFQPSSITTNQCDYTKTANLMLEPGQNLVSTIQLALKWDKTKFNIDFAPNTALLPETIKAAEQTSDGMTITLNIGADVTKAINTPSRIATITILPVSSTSNAPVQITIDPDNSKVYSLSNQDEILENVFNSASPLDVMLTAQSCRDATITPTPTVQAGTITPTIPTGTITPSPTGAVNQAPVCRTLAPSVASGTVPLSVNLTATGLDANGTISKATFNFGDGTQQDVTIGMGTASASAQASHTYNSSGTFTATVVFTDNGGVLSSACSQQITANPALTIAPTATPVPPTRVPTRVPTITQPGGVLQTVGIVGGVLLLIGAGLLLFIL